MTCRPEFLWVTVTHQVVKPLHPTLLDWPLSSHGAIRIFTLSDSPFFHR